MPGSVDAGPGLIDQFPVQGPCGFIDSFGATRSGGRRHEGVDIMAKQGQYVYAVRDGILNKKYLEAPGALAGNGWRLTTADGTYFFYGHLSAFAEGLAAGSTVVAGQIIGYVGATGNAGTPHLHFEVHPGGGSAVNPTPIVKAIDGCKITTPTPTPTATTTTTPTPTTTATTTTTTTATATTTTTPTTTGPTTTAPLSNSLARGAASRWQFIEPVAVLTASTSSALKPGVTKRVAVSTLRGINASTSAVLIRISATAKRPASVVVHPCTGDAPVATTLFVEVGSMAIGHAAVDLVNGQLCITSNASALARITVIAQLATAGVGATPVPTRRVLDTRSTARLAPNQLTVVTPEVLGTQPGAKAVTATFTVLDPKTAGTLSITSCRGNELKAPFSAARVTSFSVVVRSDETGICLKSSVATDVLVDVDAVWNEDAAVFLPTSPVRRLDSRDTGVPIGPTPTQVLVGTLAGAPTSVSAVQANLTLLGSSAAASIFVWPCNQPQPVASVGVVPAKRRATVSVLTAVSDGAFCIASNAPVHVIVDIVGVG